jgi:hypothetical protein
LKGGTCVFYVACGEDGQETSVLYPLNFEIVYYKIISKEGMNEDVKICMCLHYRGTDPETLNSL